MKKEAVKIELKGESFRYTAGVVLLTLPGEQESLLRVFVLAVGILLSENKTPWAIYQTTLGMLNEG